MRSLSAGTGCVMPNTASLAGHGVRRSIWARIMPCRKSVACLGKSMARNSTWSDRMRMSMRLPRSAASHSGVRAGSGRPCRRRNEACGSKAPAEVTRAVKLSLSPSTNRMRRCDAMRAVTAWTTAATAAIHSPKRSFSSEIIAFKALFAFADARSRRPAMTTPGMGLPRREDRSRLPKSSPARSANEHG